MTFLKNLIGPGQREVWERLCQETGAEYVPGGLLTPAKDDPGIVL